MGANTDMTQTTNVEQDSWLFRSWPWNIPGLQICCSAAIILVIYHHVFMFFIIFRSKPNYKSSGLTPLNPIKVITLAVKQELLCSVSYLHFWSWWKHMSKHRNPVRLPSQYIRLLKTSADSTPWLGTFRLLSMALQLPAETMLINLSLKWCKTMNFNRLVVWIAFVIFNFLSYWLTLLLLPSFSGFPLIVCVGGGMCTRGDLMGKGQDCITPGHLLPRTFYLPCVWEEPQPTVWRWTALVQRWPQHIASTAGAVFQWESALYSPP